MMQRISRRTLACAAESMALQLKGALAGMLVVLLPRPTSCPPTLGGAVEASSVEKGAMHPA